MGPRGSIAKANILGNVLSSCHDNGYDYYEETVMIIVTVMKWDNIVEDISWYAWWSLAEFRV